MTTLSAGQLRRAADIKDKIQSLQSELTRLLGSADGATAPGKRRKMSAAGRARIAAAAKARWAKLRSAKGAASAVAPAVKRSRTVSAAARKRLSELTKARWARVKAAGKATL